MILLPLPLLEPSLSSFFAAYEKAGPKVPCMPSVADSDSVVRLVMEDPCWGPLQAVEKVDQY